MEALSQRQVTQLLLDWSDGDNEALNRLMPLVYQELKRMAQYYMRRERADHTLQTSALVNEAYIRLVDYKKMRWQDRAHFLAVAAQAMRVDADVGTIEKGKRADLLVLDGNPLENISNIRSARFVMKDGKMFESAALWTEAGFKP